MKKLLSISLMSVLFLFSFLIAENAMASSWSSISLSPSTGKAGDVVLINGSHFDNGDTITVKITGHTANITNSVIKVSGNNFSGYITIPSDASIGVDTVTATDESHNSATASFTVSNPPTGTIKINNDAQYTNSRNVTLNFSNVSAGVNKMELRNGTSGSFQSIINYANPFSYTLPANGDGTYIVSVRFTNSSGNTSTGVISDSIVLDSTAPTATVSYSKTSQTNQNVIATITPSEAVTITNNGGSNSHSFMDNGDFTFEFIDLAGNTGTKTASVSNIDKTAPVITIGDYTKTPTNQDITVTATTNEGTLNFSNHNFTENSSFTFIATDAAGNSITKVVTITNIDKIDPTIVISNPDNSPAQTKTITAYISELGNLFMSIDASSVCDASLHFVSYDSKTFSSEDDNGKFICYKAVDEATNISYLMSNEISGIDRTAKISGISYSTTNPTNKDVVATLNPSDDITVTSDGGFTHTFSENGSFTFEFTDNVGNTGSAVANVSNIDKTAPVITIGDYTKTPTNQDITVTATTDEGTLNTGSYTFNENGNFDFVATDLAGNVSTLTVVISNINKVSPVLTLKGEPAIRILRNSDFVDEGVFVSDDIDSEISATSTNNIDISVTGVYTITYGATDSAGNSAAEISRTVTVYLPRRVNQNLKPFTETTTKPKVETSTSTSTTTPVLAETPVLVPESPTPIPQTGEVLGVSTFAFNKDLKFKDTNEDVMELQKRLIAEGFMTGEPTSYFGTKTKAAVIKYQEKYKEEILTPVGLTKGTGFVGLSTRTKLNQ